MSDEEFDAAVAHYMQEYKDQTGKDGAIYIVDEPTGAQGVIINDEAFETEFRTRMDGNQTPRQGTVLAVLG